MYSTFFIINRCQDFNMTEKTKARQVAVEASPSNPAGTLQELIENKEIFRETDISIERNSNGVTIKSSTGSSATIPAASSSNAGILTGTDKYKLDSLPELGQLNAAFNQKVDKVAGHSLVPDTQIGKLTSLPTAPQLSVSLNQKVDKVTGKGLIDPAPEDGKEYARKNGSWVEVVGGGGGGGGASALADLTDVDYGTPTDGQVLTYDAATQKSKFTDQAGGDVEEAPIDGKQYARKDAGWEEVASGGGDSSVDVYVALEDLEYLLYTNEYTTDFSPNEWMLNLREGMSNILIIPEEAEGMSALYAPIIINKSSLELVNEGDTYQIAFFKVSVLTSSIDDAAWESTYQYSRNTASGEDGWATIDYRVPLAGGGEFVPEAPNDGGVYARSNKGWRDIGVTPRVELTGGTHGEPLTFEQLGMLIHSWFDGTVDWTNRETNFSFTGVLKGVSSTNSQTELPIDFLYAVTVGGELRIYYSVKKEYRSSPLLGMSERGFSVEFYIMPNSTSNPVEVIYQYDEQVEPPVIGTTAGDKKFYFYEMLTLSDDNSSSGMGVYGARRTFEVIVDSNGFIKESSPILKLYSNSLESNGDKAFTSETTLTKTGVGVYEISGVPLLSRNGWYIETPKDRNNNIYFTLDYEEVPEENKLIIRTYEPDYSSGKAENGNPVDILEGRFVSLRFEEVEEEEVEEEQDKV